MWVDVTSQFSNRNITLDLTLGNFNAIDWTVSYSGSAAPVAIRMSATINPDDGGAIFSIAGDAVSSLSNPVASIGFTNYSLIDSLSPSNYPTSSIIYTGGETLSHFHFHGFFIEGWMWSSTSTDFSITKIEFYIPTYDRWTAYINSAEKSS